MQTESVPRTIVALYTTLADAEATLHELEAAGIPYPAIRLAAHTPADIERADLAERTALAGIRLPEQFWSLGVALDAQAGDKATELLRRHAPLAVGTLPAPDHGRGDPDRGALAWRHYVFETAAATDWAGESAGTTGTTGVISSGAFADGAKVEGNSPATGIPASDQRPSDANQQPSSDTMRPDVSTDRSRPETELKQ
ncbi:MAG: hypothetical protein M3R61_16470 [Chloroflexota bacterium]|nr:hypothetical protein [Chloroflexota bacterium]